MPPMSPGTGPISSTGWLDPVPAALATVGAPSLDALQGGRCLWSPRLGSYVQCAPCRVKICQSTS
jgi:hypothetical protein